ncbi:MAG: transglutaminase N-terminal domain-containing protein, partial [Myxococcota bacterium]
MRILLQHRSTYHYPDPAHLGPHTIRLRPAAHARANIQSYRLEVEQPCVRRWQHDVYGNHVARLEFDEAVRSLDVLVELVVDIHPVNPFDFFEDERVSNAPFRYPEGVLTEIEPFLDGKHPSLARGPLYKKLSD